MQNGKLKYEEFILVLRYLEEKQMQTGMGGGGGRLSKNPSRISNMNSNPINVQSDVEPPEQIS
jgi:hypothetical protein